MSATAESEVTVVEVLSGERSTKVLTAGAGPAVLFLHSEEHAGWSPFLEALSRSFSIYAPEVAGTEDALSTMDGLHDLMIYLLDVIDALGLSSVAVVGESFGAMAAAELAAIAAGRVSLLVLIAPLGLWKDDVPVPDLYTAPPATLAARLFGDADSAVAAAWIAGLTDRDQAVARMRAMRTAMHFVFPIPEIGLDRRLHRVKSRSLLLWGDADGVVAPSYADEFAARIPGSRIELLPGGHLLSACDPVGASTAIIKFLSAG